LNFASARGLYDREEQVMMAMMAMMDDAGYAAFGGSHAKLR